MQLRVFSNLRALANPGRMATARRAIRASADQKIRYHERSLCFAIAKELETSALSGNGSGILTGPRYHEGAAAHWIATEIARRSRFDAPRLTVEQEREECARVADKIAADAAKGRFVLQTESEKRQLIDAMHWVAFEIRLRGKR